MNIEEIREYCLRKPFSSEGLPFDENTLVFYVDAKIYALIPMEDTELKLNLKCAPEKSIELRSKYVGDITPGFHMNKKHWNTIFVNKIPGKLLLALIDHSYEMVIKGLTKKRQKELGYI